MIQLIDAKDDALKIFGACSETKLLNWLSDAVQMVAGKADMEGYKGTLDVCSAGCNCSEGAVCNNPAGCGRRCLSLPREVETVLAVNIGGQPALGYNQTFSFHINGPGDCRTACEFKWQDLGAYHSTYRDLITPAKLVTHLQTDEDNNTEFTVFGYDADGNVLRQKVNGVWQNGLRIPTIFGVALPDSDAPLVARITGIHKARTAGSVRLATIDNATGGAGVLLGVYEPDEVTPQFRRIMLNRTCNWARILYMKKSPKFVSFFDHAPMTSRLALLLALQARKFYADLKIAEAHSYEADAARLELEAQTKLEAPLHAPVQVVDMSNPRDKHDYDIR